MRWLDDFGMALVTLVDMWIGTLMGLMVLVEGVV